MSDQESAAPKATSQRATFSDGTDPISPNGWGAADPERSQRRTIVVEQDGASRAPAPPSNHADVRYRLARVGPLSVLRLSAIFSAGLLVVVLAGVAVLYLFLDAIGVLKNLQHLVNSSGLGYRFQFDLGWILTRLLWVGALMAIAGSLVVTCLAVFYNAMGEMGGGLDLSFEPVDRSDRPQRTPRARGMRWDVRRWGRIGADRPLQVGVVRDGGPDGGGDLPDASGF